jgi:Zn-dependent protease
MLLGSPDVTPYDLRFRLLGIPVRVHPLFWLVMLLISGDMGDFHASLIFVACAFISILVHEMGHGLASRLMGDEPVGIVLYAMGGFCAFHQNRLSPWRRVVVLISGPGAGFLLMGAVIAVAIAGYAPEAPGLQLAMQYLVFINLYWGVLNLFPLWPLDGGQIASTVLGMISPRHGMRWSHVISLLTAGCLAVWRLTVQDFWMALWFGYFALINYQILHSLHLSYQTSDEPEWWRR